MKNATILKDLTDAQVSEYIGLHHWIPVQRGMLRQWINTHVEEGATDKDVMDGLTELGRVRRDAGASFGWRLIPAQTDARHP
jgi:hypothetical protein